MKEVVIVSAARTPFGKFGGCLKDLSAVELGGLATAAARAAALGVPLVWAVGNAPTSLIRLCELLEEDAVPAPLLVIGVPVGFVHVVEAKEQLIETLSERSIPYIVARGRKGGSNVAAAVCNALLYQASMDRRE